MFLSHAKLASKLIGLFFLLNLLFYNKVIWACSLNKAVSIYSLSGPVSMLIEYLDLDQDEQLKGISIFHPIKNFKGKKIGGGIFLSAKAFTQAKSINVSQGKRTVVFYDESQELTKNLSKLKARLENIELIEVSTRSLDSLEATSKTLGILSAFLNNCDTKIKLIETKLRSIKSKLLSSEFKIEKMLFFLNQIKSPKMLPKMIIVNDGFVLTLIQNQMIKTYESPLSYIPWASRLLKSKYKGFLRIGVYDDSQSTRLIVQKIDNQHYNLIYKGALIPGIRQALLLDQLLSHKDFL